MHACMYDAGTAHHSVLAHALVCGNELSHLEAPQANCNSVAVSCSSGWLPSQPACDAWKEKERKEKERNVMLGCRLMEEVMLVAGKAIAYW